MDENIDDSHYQDLGNEDDNENSTFIERRVNYDIRKLVNDYLSKGWEIVSRDPVTIQRGRLKRFFRNGILIDGE